jgi:hypothetical protein
MSFEPTSIPLDVRVRFVSIGCQYGSAATLSQAEETIVAAREHERVLGEHGFTRDDCERLVVARDALVELRDQGEPPSGPRKQTSRAFVRALREGKTVRQRARSILHIIAQRLSYSGDPVQAEAARVVHATLDQTESSRGDAVRLAAQLDQLRAVLTMARVERAVADRGGPEAARLCAAAAERLREAAEDRAGAVSRRDMGDATDVIDGMIVELVRDARRAARSAARTLQQPSLAAAFELMKLHGA